jgi:hypothetical protein
VVSVLLLTAVVLLAAMALAITVRTHQNSVSTFPSTGASAGSGHVTAPKTPSNRRGHTRRGASDPRRTKATSAVGSSAPFLSSLSPSTGAAGQSVTVTGTNFLSADGQIVARFGGQVTSTSCPDETSCTVTVPALSGSPRSVKVTITTESGTSNTLNFRYG